MYFQLFILIGLSVFMYRVAEFEKRRGWLWGGITAAWCLFMGQYFAPGFVYLLICLFCSYGTMVVANIIKK